MTAPAVPATTGNTFQAGVYDLPEHVYHADPVPEGSLSSSGARKLLPPSCPALFKYEQDHQRPPRKEFDFGHAAHQMVLGTGPEIVSLDFDSWRTNAVKEEAEAARAAGKVPLLAKEYAVVKAMADQIRKHPLAGRLFEPGRGHAEMSLFWPDRRTGIWRRARPDWMPNPSSGRFILVDYKTAVSAASDKLSKKIYEFGYHLQADWYLDGVRSLGLAGKDAKFVFLFQEKTPPYLVNIAEPDLNAMHVAAIENRAAIDIYAECRRLGRWPGYSEGIEQIPLPAWVESQYSKELSW